MKYTVVKRKGASIRELGREEVELNNPRTLEDLLKQLCAHELQKEMNRKIAMQTGVGKIDFGVSYNQKTYSLDKAIEVMLQDFADGLFRIYMNGEEYTDLNEELRNQEENEIVVIKLVMMAGRLW